MIIALFSFVSCGDQKHSGQNKRSDGPVKITEADLPDRILCELTGSDADYKLILILRDKKLTEGVTVIALKIDDEVIFKVASVTYTMSDEVNVLHFSEMPVTDMSKEAKLNISNKTAVLLNSEIESIDSEAVFRCRL